MTKKTKIILLVIICLIFSVLLTIILINKPKTNIEDSTESHNYAKNTERITTEQKTEEATVYTINDYISKISDSHMEKYVNIDKLTLEQIQKEEKFYSLISGKSHKYIDKIKITSNDGSTIHVNVTYEDNKSESYIVSYDTYHNVFMHALTEDEYNELQTIDFSGI